MARRMAQGALLVGLAYVLLALVAWQAGERQAAWLWLALFFLIFTVGELFILPSGLGLFARLAPPRLGATTVAAWYLTIFAGSLSAGLVGTLWSHMAHGSYFVLLAALACLAAILLRLLDPAIRRIDRNWTDK
ncbi:POT-type proton-dependent oligopeptide transporter [Sphingomonas bisphenolicum]|uniref:Major facilitator superfamily MFS_1 n=1 Tax=Sphingomonas bisphenolicum TaxID=296544 RepID=A0ABM7G9Q7_9SPHN|nr:hypothetical protein [Sphingomonas bisphenolicum]BBF71705.1 hypothetical protein SBA_ch2_2380 [Sphingomonas bisphenolicum]